MATHPDRYDAIVVGARAAGAATAMLLARAGGRVLVVDRSRYGADTLSTHALMRGGVLQLWRWRLLDRIIGAGTPAVRQATFRFGDGEVVVPIKPSHGVDALYAPRRTVLDPILVDAADAAGAEVRFGVTVSDVQRDHDGRVTGIAARDDTGAPFLVDAPLVIGADGRRSTIAASVAAPIDRAGTGASAFLYGYWSGVATDGYEWVFRPRATAGVIPTNGGEVCVFAGTDPKRVGRGGRAVLEDVLREASPAVAERVMAGSLSGPVRTFRGQPGFLRQAWGPGWALVGDAGYWKDPISAHGLTDALRDAELLARAVIASTAGPMAGAEALAEYQAERDRLSLPLFATVDRIAGHDWTDAEIGGLLVELSSCMTDEVDALVALDVVAAA